MKRIFKYGLIFLGFILFSFYLTCGSFAETIRKPVWAGKFYPQSKEFLEEQIQDHTQQAQKTSFHPPAGKKLRAIIMPHAGYIYSGLTAAHVSLALKTNSFTKVILMGPDHRIGFENCAVSNVDAYQTPLGIIQLHKDAQLLRKKSAAFKPVPASDSMEHSLEVILPFLQQYLSSFQLVPIVVGYPKDLAVVASSIESIIDNRTLLVISSDLSHFLTYTEAVQKDNETINMILKRDAVQLSKSRLRACGIVPIVMLLKLAVKYNWQPVLIHYSNSGDTAGDKSKVVGYTAIAFYENGSSTEPVAKTGSIGPDQGMVLLSLARHTLMKRFDMKIKKSEAVSLETALNNTVFQAQRGTFVTLKINGNLRGCIGNITPHGSIAESVRRNAINAAFHDTRFSPLTEDEFRHTRIEVSILTEPSPLSYKTSADLIAKLRPNVDGVIIKKDFKNATFLPQVWQQLPDPEVFLSHLCYKAGLPSNEWKTGELDVFTYQAQYFEE